MHQFHVSHVVEKTKLIVTIHLHHNLGINNLLFIHHILCKLNFLTFRPPRLKKSSKWLPVEKRWGPLGYTKRNNCQANQLSFGTHNSLKHYSAVPKSEQMPHLLVLPSHCKHILE